MLTAEAFRAWCDRLQLSQDTADRIAATLGKAGPALTLEALTQHALQPAQRVRLEVDARAGEHKIEVGNATSHEQLQALLDISARLSLASPPPPVRPALPEPAQRQRRMPWNAPRVEPSGRCTCTETWCAFPPISSYGPGPRKM